VPWLTAATGLSLEDALRFGLWPFLPGDALKVAAAAALLPAGWWLVRRRSTDL
jgi:biotin transport system substrate-specific component